MEHHETIDIIGDVKLWLSDLDGGVAERKRANAR